MLASNCNDRNFFHCFALANSEDTEELPHDDLLFHQGPHCLLVPRRSSKRKNEFTGNYKICNKHLDSIHSNVIQRLRRTGCQIWSFLGPAKLHKGKRSEDRHVLEQIFKNIAERTGFLYL